MLQGKGEEIEVPLWGISWITSVALISLINVPYNHDDEFPQEHLSYYAIVNGEATGREPHLLA